MADKGILAASAKLAQSQIPTDVAGEFMKTFSAGVEAFEKERAGIQNEVATFMSSLKTDIDFTSLSPEMEKATRSFLTQGKNEFNELANKVARIKDPSSEGYQNAVDRMNEIQREFSTLAGELSSYNQEKINTAANFDANAYSKGVANKDLIIHKNIYGLSEAGMAPVSIQNGHLNFNVNNELVRYDKVQALAMPSEIPVKIVENAATFSGYNRALTEQEVNAQSIYLDESLKDSTTLASVLFDYQTELPFPEIQKEFLEARENGTLEEKLPDLIARTKNIILTGFQDAALEGKAAYDARTAKDADSSNNDTPNALNSTLKRMKSIQDYYNLNKGVGALDLTPDDLKFVIGGATSPISIVFKPENKNSPWEVTRKTLDENGKLTAEAIQYRSIDDIRDRTTILN
jgi:hypothetical protein